MHCLHSCLVCMLHFFLLRTAHFRSLIVINVLHISRSHFPSLYLCPPLTLTALRAFPLWLVAYVLWLMQREQFIKLCAHLNILTCNCWYCPRHIQLYWPSKCLSGLRPAISYLSKRALPQSPCMCWEWHVARVFLLLCLPFPFLCFPFPLCCCCSQRRHTVTHISCLYARSGA